MSIPTIRAALDWLLAVCDTDESNVLDIDPDRLVDAIAFARAALAAERAGEGPSDADLHRMAFSYSQPCFEFDYIGFARSILTRWGCPATPPAPEVGGGDARCARIELVTAIHCLASHFEIACSDLSGDDLQKAKSDIAHALSIAAKHNQNGPGCPHLYPAAPPVPDAGEVAS